MELLPRERAEFRTREYWEAFFERRGREAFEWYSSYSAIRPLLLQSAGVPWTPPGSLLHAKSRVLVVGCGNSDFSARLYDDGVTDVLNIDFSEKVIADMRKVNRQRRPKMRWQVMDMTSMALEDASFDAVLDKGALDALASGESADEIAGARQFLSEVRRVLVAQGVYVCVTLGQEYILRELVEAFAASAGWRADAHELADSAPPSETRAPADSQFLPLLLRFTAPAKVMSTAPVALYNVRMHFDNAGRPHPPERKPVSVVCRGEAAPVLEYLDSARASHRLRAELGRLRRGRVHRLELFSPSSSGGAFPAQPRPRYSVTVVDDDDDGDDRRGDSHARGGGGDVRRRRQPPKKRGDGRSISCGVFLVPLGREHEWLFHDEEGMRQLCRSAGCRRLVVVAMRRGESYGGLAEVQAEIGPAVAQLAPLDARHTRLPVMSVDNSLGAREELTRIALDDHGLNHLVVEDVQLGDGATRRQLVFLGNQALIQSEAHVRCASAHGGSASFGRVDTRRLCFDYHRAMLAATAHQLGAVSGGDVGCGGAEGILLVGLGGGGLATALRAAFPRHPLTAVEVEAVIPPVARKYFDLPDDEPGALEVLVEDGLEYVRKAPAGAFAAVLFDVDNKNAQEGMSCPPRAFVEEDFLRQVRRVISARSGALVLNMAARSAAARTDTVRALENVFGEGSLRELRPSDEEVNVVLVATVGEKAAMKTATTYCEDAELCNELALDELVSRLAAVRT